MRTLFLFLLLASVLPAFAAVTGWLNDGTALFPDATPQLTWSATERVVWATELPKWGNASPVLVGDRIFVTAEPDLLICLNTEGKILWQQQNTYKDCPADDQARLNDDYKLPITNRDNGYTQNTVVSDGASVWVALGSGVVASYTLDGTRQWIRFLEKTTHQWGQGSSPKLVDGKIIIQYLTLFALDAKTGNDVWATPRLAKNWGTPGVFTLGKRTMLLTDGGFIVDTADGAIVGSTGMKLDFGSPQIIDGIAYCASNDTAAAYTFSEEENGKVKATRLWATKVAKERYYATPILHDGLLYVINQRSILSVLDAKTGEKQYEQNLGLRGITYTTPVLCGNVVILASEDQRNGTVAVVMKPGATYEELGRNTTEAFRTTPLCVGPRMYLRTTNSRGASKLYCFGEK